MKTEIQPTIFIGRCGQRQHDTGSQSLGSVLKTLEGRGEILYPSTRGASHPFNGAEEATDGTDGRML